VNVPRLQDRVNRGETLLGFLKASASREDFACAAESRSKDIKDCKDSKDEEAPVLSVSLSSGLDAPAGLFEDLGPGAPPSPGLKPWAGRPCPCGTADRFAHIAVCHSVLLSQEIASLRTQRAGEDISFRSRPAGTRVASPGFQSWAWGKRTDRTMC
jgi:hypothetical protein